MTLAKLPSKPCLNSQSATSYAGRSFEKELRALNQFGSKLAEISARLMRINADSLDGEILRSLEEIFEPLGVDRGGLLVVVKDSPVVSVSHVWYRQGIETVDSEINLAELFPWAYQQLVVEGKELALPDCDKLPPEAEVDRKSWALLGTKSTLDVPLFIGKRVHHLLAINSLRFHRDWPEELITKMRLFGEIIVSALERREADTALQMTKDRLDLSADSADAGLWELDLATGSFWTTRKALQMFGYPEGATATLENIFEKIHPDDHALIHDALEQLSPERPHLAVQYRVIEHAGSSRWMSSRGRLQQCKRRGCDILMGVTVEITNLKRMEQQLQAQLQEIARLRDQLEEENTYLRNESVIAREGQKISGISHSMRTILAQVEQVANTGSTVLIQGETGTGKEIVAQAIHERSDRRKRIMVKVNCAALPAALVESELFGREKGAFTGALSRQPGRFELADGSTLFLDEIAEMPLETQAKLLRVLQDGEFERLGSSKTIKCDVRVIAASNRNLTEEVAQGRFRQDLFYRLNVFPLYVPPLRERAEDIPHLVWEFVNEFSERMGKKIRRIEIHDMELLKSYDWPGNVRELRNMIEHALIISTGDTLNLQCFSNIQPSCEGTKKLEEVERQHIQKTIKETNGRIKGAGGAAELLGLPPSTLFSRMRKLGIKNNQKQALRGDI